MLDARAGEARTGDAGLNPAAIAAGRAQRNDVTRRPQNRAIMLHKKRAALDGQPLLWSSIEPV
jgi:hypothetical protein